MCMLRNVHIEKLVEVPGLHCTFAVLVIFIELQLPVYFTNACIVLTTGQALIVLSASVILTHWDLPSGPVVKTPPFHCRVRLFDCWLGH